MQQEEIIIIDGGDDDDEEYMRNATVISRRPPMSPFGRPGNRRPSVQVVSGNRVPVVRPRPGATPSLGNLSIGTLIGMGAQVLAAVQPLPEAPRATGKPDEDLANLIAYQAALAAHAKANERIRTVGSLAGKLIA